VRAASLEGRWVMNGRLGYEENGLRGRRNQTLPRHS
jgi:hypothetical protein